VLVFVSFCAAFFVFTCLLINFTRMLERHRGVAREDGMLGDGMKWAEGREVIERKIIYEGGGSQRPMGDRRPQGASKLSK
jgi:hypothetical protein